MVKQKKMLVVFMVLVVMMMWVWMPIIIDLFSPSVTTSLSSSSTTAVSQVTSFPKTERVMETDIPHDWGRSPFVDVAALKEHTTPSDDSTDKSSSKETEAAPSTVNPIEALTLHGIFWNKHKPSVLINNQVYGVGDEVDGLIITAITTEKVLFSWGDQQYALTLKRE